MAMLHATLPPPPGLVLSRGTCRVAPALENLLMKFGLRKRVHFSPEQKEKMAREPQVSLVVIGVAPACQGKGYGSLLLKEFERRAVEVYGIRRLQLTVRADNVQAIRAYERNGWVRVREQGASVEMVKRLGEGVALIRGDFERSLRRCMEKSLGGISKEILHKIA